jgi:hypothetical protein
MEKLCFTGGFDNSTAMSSHGQLNVFTGGHDICNGMKQPLKIKVFTGGHDTSTAMSSHGQLNVSKVVMTLVLQ